MRFALLLLVCAVQEDALVAREKERLKTRPPLSEAQKAAYPSPEGPAIKPRAAYTLAVVPVEFSDRALAPRDLTKLVFGSVRDYYAMNTELASMPAYHDRILQVAGSGGVEHINVYEDLTKESLRGRTGGATEVRAFSARHCRSPAPSPSSSPARVRRRRPCAGDAVVALRQDWRARRAH